MEHSNAWPVTHPPLTPDALADLESRHHSPAAITLFREVARLRAVEANAKQLLQWIESAGLTGGNSTMHLVAMSLRASLEGRLPLGGKWDITKRPTAGRK